MSAKDEHLRDLIAEQAADFFAAHRSSSLSDVQEQEFLQWLRTSPIHVAEYLAVADLSRDLDSAAKTIDTPLEELVAAAEMGSEVIALNTAPPVRQSAPGETEQRHRSRTFLRWGAIAAVYLTVLGALSFYYFRADNGIEITSGHGELRTFQLADDTIVHLNSDSAISVKFDATHRFVNVERGEVYFKVAEDPKRQFEVRAGEAVLKDIGTSFDVYRRSGKTIVSVAEGQVAVHRLAEPASVVRLVAGDQATVQPTRIVESNSPTGVRRATAWLKQEIIFDRTTIAEAVAQFNRYTQTRVVVDDPRVAKIAISGMFHVYDLASFAQFLDGLPNVEAAMKDNVLHVTSDNGKRAQDE